MIALESSSLLFFTSFFEIFDQGQRTH
jgi:hypothetical protein